MRHLFSKVLLRQIFCCLALLGAALPLYAQTPDAEALLASDQAATRVYKDIVKNNTKLSPQQRDARLNWFLMRYPGTNAAAQAEFDDLHALFQAGQLQQFVNQAPAILDRYSDQRTLCATPLYSLARILIDQKNPAGLRQASLRVLLPRVQNAPFILGLTHNYLWSDKTLSSTQKYQLAKQGEEAAGPSALARDYLWDFLNAFVQDAPSADAKGELERFVQRYPEDSAAGVSAHQALLALQVKDGDTAAKQQLQQLQEKEKTDAAAVKVLFDKAQKAAAAGEIKTVQQTFDALAKFPPHDVDNLVWSAVLGKALSGAPQAAQAALVEQVVKIVPPGKALDYVRAVLQQSGLINRPEGVRLLMELLSKNASDILRDGSNLEFLTRLSPLQSDPQLKLEALRTAAQISLKLGLKDAAAEYFFKIGKYSFTTDPAPAQEALRQAVQVASASSGGIEANWLLTLLNGKMHIVAPYLARNTIPSGKDDLPLVPLPKISDGNNDVVIVQNGTYSLAKYDPAVNLLAGQIPTVSSGQATAAAATDGKAETGWQPAQLPANLIVPLNRTATISRLSLKFSDPALFAISLLDEKGHVLATYSRAWSFWDDLTLDYPKAETTFNLPPVPGARFVRVNVFDVLNNHPALKEIAAYPTPFAAQGRHELPPRTLPVGTTSLQVNWQAQLPSREVTYKTNDEAAQAYPVDRWTRPWLVNNFTVDKEMGMEFYGSNATLSLKGLGGVRWSIDGNTPVEISQKNTGTSSYELSKGLASGRHYLRVANVTVPGNPKIEINTLTVQGQGNAGVSVRFRDGETWSAWQGPFSGTDGARIAVPEGKWDAYQVGIELDARALQAQQTPVLSHLSVQPVTVATTQKANAIAAPTTVFPEQLDKVAAALASREVVVAYAKTGTHAEYETAVALAHKAGVYLVSDDIGLNLYPGLVLAVGTPHDNRYAHQLPAMAGLTDDGEFWNNADGVVGISSDLSGQKYFYVTGSSPAAVQKAAARLLAKVPQYHASSTPFRLFPSNTLEMVYPWQLHPGKPDLKELNLRLGVNDRRDIQFGLTAQQQLTTLNVIASELHGPDGSVIPAPQVRAVGDYEWIPFFGDLRLPNFLVDQPRLPQPANTANGFWITVRTSAATKPGTYHGTVTVNGNGFSQKVPLTVTVAPVKLPDFARINTFSFATVPWWYQPGTAAYDKALQALATDEAEHSVNTVSPKLRFSWKVERGVAPAEYAVADSSTSSAQLHWQPFTAQPKKIPAGQALFVRFADAIAPREIGGGFLMGKNEKVLLSAIDAKGAPRSLPEQSPLASDDWAAVRIPCGDVQASVFRIESSGGAAFSVGDLSAFLQKEQAGPVIYDFSNVLHQMDIYDNAYKQRGLQPPVFLMRVHSDLATVSKVLFGVNNWYNGGGVLATQFVQQFKTALKTKGRDDRTILKISDEPSDIAQWAASAKPYKAGGLPVMTAHGTSYPNMQVAVGIMDPWCPNYQHDLFNPFLRQRQKAGDKLWWYECGVPPTRITGTPIDNLPFYWLTAKWHLDGALNYAALNPAESGPEGSDIPFRYDHGLKYQLNYLPDGTLLDTTRRELAGDGIQDYKVIEFIRDRIAALRKDGQKAKADTMETKLNNVMESVVPAKYGYPQNPQSWLRARSDLYDLAIQ